MNKLECLPNWLSVSTTESDDRRYVHCLVQENLVGRGEAIAQLRLLVEQAHEDFRQHLRSLASDSLDPLNSLSMKDPALGYPEMLDMETLKGYFGEIFAGVVAEYFSPFGESNWKVPAFLFRFHSFAFHELERWRQAGGQVKKVVGRPGDDCLAFLRNERGQIISCIVCEAKCTSKHNAAMISAAHKKVSDLILLPVNLLQIVEVLRDRKGDEDAANWIEALQELRMRDASVPYERFDLVSYICGQVPKKAKSWIPLTKSHPQYTGRRKLEAVEVRLTDVDGLVREVYKKTD